MATLLVYRGASLVNRIPFGDHDLRIGRGDGNDVVLPDADKAVSRFHAELRLENGAWVIYDLNSQNGVWIDAAQVKTRAAVKPGQEVVIGPYRLTYDLQDMEEPEPASGDTYIELAPPVTDVPDTVPPMPPLPSRPTPPANRPTSPATPSQSRASGTGIQTAKSTPPPERTATPAPPPKPAFDIAKWYAENRSVALYSGVGGLAVVAAIVAVVVFSGAPPAPPPPAPVTTSIQPTPIDPSVEQYRIAKEVFDRGEFQVAVADHLEPLLAANPEHQEAALLWTQAQVLLAPPPPVTTKLPTPPKDPVVNVVEGIRQLSAESDAEFLNRVEQARSRYASGERQLTREEWSAAIQTFEGLRSEHPDFRDSAAKAQFARDKLDEARRAATDSAQKLETAGDLPGAAKEFVRALALGADVKGDIDRVNGKARTLAQGLLNRAKVAENFNRQDAIALYRRIAALLPAEDPDREYAESRLRVLAP